ncbi:hypothetical protein Ga0074812_12833 [Parafrankia irregularis]|uniref:Uncharacterized protein n=1 Tax=Parafrankia irregularis TaxID=795642 RepID=A0A0S4QV20_9ACTN|nr:MULTISPECIES: hypothetical protein [Frankiaceae]MBE3201948.1 hypothetical protein [Parafrankia sp. CH37]CUU59463.1 hypothetical protein Ga0074812_12833 [Parafrankia irregularis]
MVMVSGALVAVAAVLAVVGLFGATAWTYTSLVVLCVGAALLPLAVARRTAGWPGAR